MRTRLGDEHLRVLYVGGSQRVFVLLHAFVKRTSKTPEREIEIAKARLADYAKPEDQQKR